MRYIPRLLPYLRPYWKLALLSIAVLVASSLFTLLTPWPFTIVVDSVLGNKPLPPAIAHIAGGLAADRSLLLIAAVTAGLLITFVTGALDVFSNYVNTKIDQRIVYAFRADMFQHTQRLSLPFADQISTGRLMYAINFEAVSAGGALVAVEPLAQGAFTIVGMVAVSFQIDPLLALLSVAIMPAFYYSVGFYAKHIQPRLAHVKGMEGDSLSIVHEALSMLQVVVAFAREAHEVRRFREQGAETVDARVDVTVRQATFGLAVSVLTAIGNALVMGFGAWHVIQGQLTTGQLLVVLSYIAAVYKPLQAISHTIGDLQNHFVGLQMGFHVLDTQPAVEEPPNAIQLEKAKGHVVFEGVYFDYPGRAGSLEDITFEVQAGQIVGIVGPTGAGKTTLVSLLPRFYDRSAGRILLDGVDIRQLRLMSLRDQISLVPQEPVLFSGSIADNIRYGRLDATMDEIIEAAKAANSHDFIMRLPNQYATSVGERGVQLSGGERQRICVARAFLKDAPILILDEPTSSVDSKTEAVILDALDRLMVGRTTFLIAHRLSTVRSADLILVLDEGKLVEHGPSDALLQHEGLYWQLHEAQHGSQRQRRPAEPSPALHPVHLAALDAPAEEPDWSVEWLAHEIPAEIVSGERLTAAMTFRNSGARPWRASPGEQEPEVLLSYHWLSEDGGSVVAWDGLRTRLPHDVSSGVTCTAELSVASPETPGAHRLQVTLLRESIAWFEQLGAPTLTVPVTVRGTEPCRAADVARDAPKLAAAEGPAVGGRPSIVLMGVMAKTPVAGVVWQTLHYLLGFQRLGYNVTYVEAHAVHPPMFPTSQAAAGFIGEVMRRFDLQNHWAFQALHDDGACYGLSERQVKDRCASADLVINLHGATAPLPEHRSGGCLVYLETDPVAMQIDLHHNEHKAIDFLAQHDVFFTFGENYSRPDCRLPVSPLFNFKPTRQPVVMDLWRPLEDGARNVFTTVGSWKQADRHSAVQLDDEAYSWSKHYEFLKFLDLPRYTDQPFELALAKCDEPDRSLLQSYGWRVRDALSFSLNLDAYRTYVGESRGEFTVAKDQNIRLRSGWFSDRSATYLAAGRPVINQDTGFGNFLPTGQGLFAFSTVEEILQALDAIKADYDGHRRAAYELAQEHFNSDVVLGRLVKELGR